MNILAIETSSTACSVALLSKGKITEIHKIAPMQQTQLVLPSIDELLRSQDIEPKQLDAIAFGCGPGSFTGIRIATSVAQGLGYALNIPLIPISSLAALAQAAFNRLGWKQLIIAIDARIQEIYWGLYEINAQGLAELSFQESMGAPNTLFPNLESLFAGNQDLTKWYGVGNAWEIYKEQLNFAVAGRDTTCLATASTILELAIPCFKKQKWYAAHEISPVYLRDEVATKEKKG